MKITNTQPAIGAYSKNLEESRSAAKQGASSPGAFAIAKDSVSLGQGMTVEAIQKALMTEVGQRVAAAMDAAGIDLEAYAGMDLSPEATADRIADFTLGFWGMYQQQHADESTEEQAAGFEKLVRGAVDEGFQEAMQILSTFEASQEAISTAERTISLVSQKFDDFFAQLREPQAE